MCLVLDKDRSSTDTDTDMEVDALGGRQGTNVNKTGGLVNTFVQGGVSSLHP